MAASEWSSQVLHRLGSREAAPAAATVSQARHGEVRSVVTSSLRSSGGRRGSQPGFRGRGVYTAHLVRERQTGDAGSGYNVGEVWWRCSDVATALRLEGPYAYMKVVRCEGSRTDTEKAAQGK